MDAGITFEEYKSGKVMPEVAYDYGASELYSADEAFLCGSAMELRPVLSIDRCELGSAGETTAALHKAYLEAARGRNDDLSDWVTPIY